jgi:hypothetical protein
MVLIGRGGGDSGGCRFRNTSLTPIQNIDVLLRYGDHPKKRLFVKVNQVIQEVTQPISGVINRLMATEKKKNMSLDLVCVGFNGIWDPTLSKKGI